ncbi:MAG: hypothetical protein IPM57_06490 [Oligoflexia bacterium]|nr:hypothetical protein [Oligoflexia bacterium]
MQNNDANMQLDLSVLDYNFELEPEQRLINHQRSFELLQELQRAREELQLNEEFKLTTESTSRE